MSVMHKKCVSVVVPVYNMENRIKRCLDSLVNQTLKDIEIIVINDGSCDKSIDIIKEYEKKYKNIKVVDRENKGISYTRNEGIILSTGEYIAFVDSDDYVELDMFEKLYNEITKNKSDIVICNFNMFNELNDNIIKQDVSKRCFITDVYSNPKMIYKFHYAPWNKLYKRSLWNNVQYPIGVKYEDLEAVLKVFLKAKHVTYISDYLYNYLENPTGETATVNEKVFDIFVILNNLMSSFNNKTELLKGAFKELCTDKVFIYNHYILNTRNREFSKRYMKSGYEFLNKNFKHWKFTYIKNSENFKDFIMRCIQTNKFIYDKYINFRTR